MADTDYRSEGQPDLFPNGILADTGMPLPSVDDDAGQRVAARAEASKAELKAADDRANAAEAFGAVDDVMVDDLAQAGWGIIFAADVDSLPFEQALAPLIERRKSQAGERFRIFKGTDGWKTGESVPDWLGRQGKDGQGPGLDIVDPSLGVPYYLMIVGSPAVIPMDFQYMLDIYWAVGRLHFDEIAGYAAYARSVVDYETAEKPPQRIKQAAIFATEHPFDAATHLFAATVARPFTTDAGAQKPIGKQLQFKLDVLLGADATKTGLDMVLKGGRPNGSPALLFSGSHGMVFGKDDARQAACQGALVCQDWEGFGSISEKHWFSAGDLSPDARVHGMIHFLFACYGGGWEMIDTFRDGPGGQGRQISARPGVSRLPQAMLSHPKGGALAVIAHVDRAWSYSFKTPSGSTQTQGLREVLNRIMAGRRVGDATDRFNVRWAALSAPLANALRDFQNSQLTGRQLARLWIARDDARNYTILGDPAVQLRVKEMVDAA